MYAIVIDTLRFSDRLKAAGFDPLHAEGMARALNDELAEKLVTQPSLDAGLADVRAHVVKELGDFRSYVDNELGDFRSYVDNELGDFRSYVDKELGDFRSYVDKELADLRSHVDAGFEVTRSEIVSLGADMHVGFNATVAAFKTTEAGFRSVDARFDAVDARFDAVDARFDAVDAKFDAQFDAVDARFDAVHAKIDALDRTMIVQGRYVFLVLGLIAALGLFNAAPRLLHGFGVAQSPASGAGSQLDVPAAEARAPTTTTPRSDPVPTSQTP